jgi:hypothetical protein
MDDLSELNQAFGEAEKSKNIDFFQEHLAENMIFRRASGKITDKAQFLTGLVNPKLVYHEIATEVIEPIAYSDDKTTAAVKAIVTVDMTNDGKDIKGSFTNFRFFKNENGTWKLLTWYNEPY